MGKGNEMVCQQHQQREEAGNCRISRRGIADWPWSLVNTSNEQTLQTHTETSDFCFQILILWVGLTDQTARTLL